MEGFQSFGKPISPLFCYTWVKTSRSIAAVSLGSIGLASLGALGENTVDFYLATVPVKTAALLKSRPNAE